jgi:hypothetical protein
VVEFSRIALAVLTGVNFTVANEISTLAGVTDSTANRIKLKESQIAPQYFAIVTF